tara:strand:- start:842 stop:1030 length:189 start_codon:yes stop_codon:yes gene_type:complete
MSRNAMHYLIEVKNACRHIEVDPTPILEDMTSGDHEHLLECYNLFMENPLAWEEQRQQYKGE